MTPPMEKCPFAPKGTKGAHLIHAIIPGDHEHPAILWCEKCGATKAVRVDFPPPADTYIAAVDRMLRP